MIVLFGTIFVASLIGSLHCAGMCGAFLAIVVGNGRAAWKSQLAYHGGRLITYAGLGAAAGAIGKMIDLAGALAGLQPIAIVVAAMTTITFGIVTWLNTRGVHLNFFRPPPWMASLAGAVHRIAMQHHPVTRAFIIGLATTLLPCGWLYAFAAAAAGTASPILGSLCMLAFWLGTLPLMAMLGLGIRGLLGTAAARVPALTCAALVAVGLYTLSARAHLSPASLIRSIDKKPHPEQLSTKPPCCQDKDERSH